MRFWAWAPKRLPGQAFHAFNPLRAPFVMEQFAKETLPVSLEAEMRHSYLDYAMSVIVGRALPDVRDGLKPVHRRVPLAMHERHHGWHRPQPQLTAVAGDGRGQNHRHARTATY